MAGSSRSRLAALGAAVRGMMDERGLRRSELDSLSDAELEDLGTLLEIARYVHARRESGERTLAVLGELVSIIEDSAYSAEAADRRIDELSLETRAALERIRAAGEPRAHQAPPAAAPWGGGSV